LLAVQKQILGIDKLAIELGLANLSDDQILRSKEVDREVQDFKNATLLTDRVNATSTLASEIITFLKQAVNEDKLGVDLDLILNKQDEATLVKLLGLFKKNLADPSQMEELINVAVLSLQEVIHEEQSQVEIKMFGLINVGNYHRIDVALNLSAGYLKKYIELVPRKAEVKAIQFGLVNVYTIDDITVKPNFHSAMKLHFETAALERALKELQLVE
jgi:hypothetical protein